MLRISVWRLDSPATARKPYGKGVRAMVRRFTFLVNAAHRLCRPSSRRKRILVKAPERNVTLSWLNAKHAGVGPLRRPEPFGDLEPHLSAAEGLIAQMRIRNPRVGMARDGHEPNEAEEQRPRRVPVKPVHVNSSPNTVETNKNINIQFHLGEEP